MNRPAAVSAKLSNDARRNRLAGTLAIPQGRTQSGPRTAHAVQSISALDGSLILPAPWQQRSPLAFVGPEFESLVIEVRRNGGNELPVLVRPLVTGVGASNKIDVRDGKRFGHLQLVYGQRRLRACLLAGVPVRAVIAELDDRQAVEAMVAENSNRADPSAWERGRFYLQVQESKVYPSLTAMAKALGKDKGDVSRALSIARLPCEILSALADSRTLALHDGSAIRGELERNKAAALEKVKVLVKKEGLVSARVLVDALTSKPLLESSLEKADKSICTVHVAGQAVAELAFRGQGKLTLNITRALAPDQIQQATEALKVAVHAIFDCIETTTP